MSDSSIIGRLAVSIVGRMDELDQTIDAATKRLGNFGKNATELGKSLTLGISAPIAAATTGLVALGDQFDGAYDGIRATTGKTGDALEGLQDDFRAVLADTPAGFEDVSTAIAGLSSQLNLTGPDLQNVSKQVIELSRLTGEDLKTTIGSTAKMFADAGVPTKDYGKVLDYVFNVHQKTGVEISRLMDLMKQFGSPLRQLGIGYETSAALLGKFEKEGVNTELVMGSLRIALAKMAKDGVKDTSAGLLEIIKKIKEAGSAGEATSLAMDAFGAKAGPDMAAAIREGRFEVASLIDTLKNSPETIATATSDTADWAESFAKLKNQIFLALEPLAGSLFNAISTFVPIVTAVAAGVKALCDGFNALPGPAQITIAAIVGLAAAVGPVLMVIGAMSTGLSAVIGFLPSLGIGAAAAAEGTTGLAAAFGGIALPVAAVVASLGLFTTAVIQLWNDNQRFRDSITALWLQIQNTGQDIFGKLQVFWKAWGDDIVRMFTSIWELIKAIIGAALIIISDVLRIALAVLTGDWKNAWEGIKKLFSDLWVSIEAILKVAVNSVVTVVTGLAGSIAQVFDNIIKSAFNWGANLLSAFIDGIKSMIGNLISSMQSVGGTVEDYIGFHSPTRKGPGSEADVWGPNLVNTLADGIDSELSRLQSTMGNFAISLNPALAASGGLSAGSGTTSSTPITINVYDGVNGLKRELSRLGVRML